LIPRFIDVLPSHLRDGTDEPCPYQGFRLKFMQSLPSRSCRVITGERCDYQAFRP
jgi:hypothetical protein